MKGAIESAKSQLERMGEEKLQEAISSYEKPEEKRKRIEQEEKESGIARSKEEKEKCRFYLDKGIFSRIWIAKQGAPKGVTRGISGETPSRGKKRGEIEYIDFAEKYNKA